MLTDEQQKIEVDGINAGDCVILLQTINRLVQTGRLQDNELLPLGTTRRSLIRSLRRATGVDFEKTREALLRQQQEEASAAQPPAPPELQESEVA